MQGLLCLLDGMALGHVVQSYVNEATITFTADREIVKDPEFYSQCIWDSFLEMAEIAGIDLSPPKAKPAPKKAASSSTSRAKTKRKPRASTAKKSSAVKAKAKAG